MTLFRTLTSLCNTWHYVYVTICNVTLKDIPCSCWIRWRCELLVLKKRFKKQIHFLNLIKRCLGKWANIWDRRTQEGWGLDRSVWRSERSCLVWHKKACCPSMGLYTAEVKQKRQVFKPATLYLFLSTCWQSPQRLHNNLIFMPFSFHLDGDQLLHSAPIRCPYLEGLQGCCLRMLGAVLRACVMELCVWVCLWSCPEVSSL